MTRVVVFNGVSGIDCDVGVKPSPCPFFSIPLPTLIRAGGREKLSP